MGSCPCHLPSSLHSFLEENIAKKHHFGHISCARVLERGFVCHLSRLPEPDVSTPILRMLRHVWLVQQPCPIARSTTTQTTATSTCSRCFQQITSPTHPPRSFCAYSLRGAPHTACGKKARRESVHAKSA
ncbi:unnamed protein product, partial [Ectocarpus sp. 4 AP-2014]